MISQHWFRCWLGAIKQQAITWANADQDLCHHTASLDHTECIVNDPRENMSRYIFSTVVADGLALLRAMISAGIAKRKFCIEMYTTGMMLASGLWGDFAPPPPPKKKKHKKNQTKNKQTNKKKPESESIVSDLDNDIDNEIINSMLSGEIELIITYMAYLQWAKHL